MSVEDWIHILNGLPPHLEVYMSDGNGLHFPVCGESDIQEIEDEGAFIKALVMQPCCHRDDIKINTDTHPN